MIAVEIEWNETEMQALGKYTPGVRGDGVNPEEPSEFEIEQITINGVDVTTMLDDCWVKQGGQFVPLMLRLSELACEVHENGGD